MTGHDHPHATQEFSKEGHDGLHGSDLALHLQRDHGLPGHAAQKMGQCEHMALQTPPTSHLFHDRREESRVMSL